MIQLFHLSKKYGSHIALCDINLRIVKGEFIFVTGPSGAGKTTLLRLIFGAEKPETGSILINSVNLTRISQIKSGFSASKNRICFSGFQAFAPKDRI